QCPAVGRERSGAEGAARCGAQRARALDAALPVRLLALPRGARRAAHRERRRARLRAQPPVAPRVQRGPDEGAGRRLEIIRALSPNYLETDSGDLAADGLHGPERILILLGRLDHRLAAGEL